MCQFSAKLGPTSLALALSFASDAKAQQTYELMRAAGTDENLSVDPLCFDEQAKPLANDGMAGDYFGCAVSLSRDTALVGARLDNDTSGSAYVFIRSATGWTQQAKLFASDGASADQFGDPVSLSGDTALVGVHGDDDNGTAAGSAYVFVRSGTSWTQQAKLQASDGAAGDLFGCAVAVSVDAALVGALGDDDNGSFSGSAYVFVRSGTSWMQRTKLLASDGAPDDEFGRVVSLSGDTALVGADEHDSDAFNSGAAYVFVRAGTDWTQLVKLTASDAASDDMFAHAVGVSGDTALVGAWFDDDAGDTSGSAYVFALPPKSGTAYCTCPLGPCGNSDPGAGCANSTGEGASLTAYGTTSPDEVTLFVSGATPWNYAIFFQADEAVMLPFGDGFRCAAGGIVPLTALPIRTGPDGSAAYGPCSGDPSISSTSGVVPGSGVTKRYQFWYRDPGGPCGSHFNLSNGYEILW